jgi:hypothetical protein
MVRPADERSGAELAEPVAGHLHGGRAFDQHETPLAGACLIRQPDPGRQYRLIAGQIQPRP